MGLFSKLTSAEAGRLEGVLFGGLAGQDDETWDETAGLIDDLRDEHPRVPPGVLGFRLGGKRR